MSKGITFEKLNGEGLKIGVVAARWNEEYTSSLRADCVRALRDTGVSDEDIVVSEVPGSFEVVLGAKYLLDQGVDAVVAIGCLIKGETMHFEYICDVVSTGLMQLGTDIGKPVIFGVLTCLTEEQARVRSIGEHNHGYGWGQSAVEMALLGKQQ